MHTVNLAIQVLPKADNGSLSRQRELYALIDKAISVVINSGFPYRVTPFETVVEAPYDAAMQLAAQLQETCFDNGADELLVFMKLQRRRNADVHIEEKTAPYEN